MDHDTVRHFFDEFYRISTLRNIPTRHKWNMDETGLRIGVGRG
jgi:transposase-like protein